MPVPHSAESILIFDPGVRAPCACHGIRPKSTVTCEIDLAHIGKKISLGKADIILACEINTTGEDHLWVPYKLGESVEISHLLQGVAIRLDSFRENYDNIVYDMLLGVAKQVLNAEGELELTLGRDGHVEIVFKFRGLRYLGKLNGVDLADDDPGGNDVDTFFDRLPLEDAD